MSKQTINIGASPNDGTGTPLRTSFDYTNQNFTEIYTALGGGVALPGATTQVIFNDGGTNLAGDAGLVYNKTTDALTVAGLVTAGSATITGDLTVRTNKLFVNATGVGVGTTNVLGDFAIQNGSNCRFEVSSSAGGTAIENLNNARNAYLNMTMYADAYIFNRLGSEAMRLNSTGLGIGAVPSSWVGAGGPVILLGGANGNVASNTQYLNITSNAYYNAGYKYVGTGLATNYTQNQGAHEWHVAPSGTAGNAITFTQAMTLTAAGKLNIGNASGDVGLLFVRKDSLTDQVVQLQNEALTGKMITFHTNGNNQVGSISFTVSSVAYNTSSDYRLKESVKPISGGLARVNALKPSAYKWKVDGSNGEGFIAHELAETVPFAVTGDKDAVDADGKPTYQGVDLSKLVPILVAAIQELTAEVNALKNA